MTVPTTNPNTTGAEAQTASDGIKDTKRKITRNRVSLSCQACRQRKVKCDRQHPVCGTCHQNKETCIYEEDKKSSKLDTDFGLGRKRRKLAPDEMDAASPSSAVSGNQSVTLQALEGQLSLLKSLVESFRNGTTLDQQVGSLGGLLTPVTSAMIAKSTTNDDNLSSLADDDSLSNIASLTQPLEKLDLQQETKENKDTQHSIKVAFWNYIHDEVTHLSSVIRRHNVKRYAASESPSEDESDDDQPAINYPIKRGMYPSYAPLSFHQLAAFHGGVKDKIQDGPIKRMFEKSILIEGIQVWHLALGPPWNNTFYVPTESQSRVLYRSWMANVHPALAITCPLRVWEVHEAFWTLQRQKKSVWESTYVVKSLPLLYAIWYAGARSLSKQALQTWFPDTNRPTLCANYHDETIHWLKRNTWPIHATTAGLVAFMILQSLPIMEEEPAQNAAYVSLIVRAAQNLGLHRITNSFAAKPLEYEYYKRMWWHVMYLDITQAIAGRHPPVISDGSWETPIPDEVNDAVLYLNPGPTQAAPGVQTAAISDPIKTSTPSTHSMIARARAYISRTLRFIASLHFKLDQVNKVEWESIIQMVDQTENDITDIINRIPTKGLPELGFTPKNENKSGAAKELEDDPVSVHPVSQSEIYYAKGLIGDCGRSLSWLYRQKQIALNRWARIYLSALTDQIQCIAVAPVVRNAKSKVWNFARQCSLRYPMSYMRKFLELATDPTIEPYRWTWPGDFQPIHAISMLLVDLYSRPRSVEAARMRTFIDIGFSLANTNSGPIIGLYGKTAQRPFREGGSDLWELTRQLRDKAWRKAGLKPDYLWTEESQIVLGIADPPTDEQLVSQSIREDTVGIVESGKGSLDILHKAIRQAQKEVYGSEKMEQQEKRDATKREMMIKAAGDAASDENCPDAVAERLGLELMPFPMKEPLRSEPLDKSVCFNYLRPSLNFIPELQENAEEDPSASLQARLIAHRKDVEDSAMNDLYPERSQIPHMHDNMQQNNCCFCPTLQANGQCLNGTSGNTGQIYHTYDQSTVPDNPVYSQTLPGICQIGTHFDGSMDPYQYSFQPTANSNHLNSHQQHPNFSLVNNANLQTGIDTYPTTNMGLDWNDDLGRIHPTRNIPKINIPGMELEGTVGGVADNAGGGVATGMEFDWDRWDSVFGVNNQYMGLTDVMNNTLPSPVHMW